MTLGRLFAWSLLSAAILFGSADMVLALGPGDRIGIDTGHILTLLSGYTPENAGAASFMTLLCAAPAWLAFGALGLVMLALSRPRPRRRRRYRVRTAEAAP